MSTESQFDEMALSNVHLPQKITTGLAQHGFGALHAGVRQGVGPGGGVDGDAVGLEHALDAEDVVGIADGNAVFESAGVEDAGNAMGGFGGVGALGFRNQAGFGDAAMDAVLRSYAPFTEAGIAA